MNEEVHLESLSIDVPQNVQKPCLDATGVQAAQDVKHSDWRIGCHWNLFHESGGGN